MKGEVVGPFLQLELNNDESLTRIQILIKFSTEKDRIMLVYIYIIIRYIS